MKKESMHSRELLYRIFVGVSLFIVLSTMAQFYLYLNQSVEELDNNMNTILVSVQDRLNTIDRLYFLIEGELDKEMDRILKSVDEKYRDVGNIDFDLKPFVANDQNMDLYVIDVNNVVVKTTDPLDLNLSLGVGTHFADFLKEVREGNKYVSNRIDLSSVTSNIKKYGYYGSYDSKYIFETGYDMAVYNDFLGDDSLSNLVSNTSDSSHHILGVRVYNYNQKSYNDDFVLVPEEFPDRFQGFIDAQNEFKITKVVIKKNNLINEYYYYIPFVPERKYKESASLILELGYTDLYIKQDLLFKFCYQICVIGIFIFIIAWQFRLYERNVLNPLKIVYEGMQNVSHDKLELIENINVNNEMQIVGDTFNEMIIKLKDSFQTIQTYNDELEFLVEERTEELTQANVSLSKMVHQLEQAQSELVDKERLKAINRVIVEMSHRLNTPLGNSISSFSYVDFLLSNRGEEFDQECIEDLNETVANGLRSLTVAIDIINALSAVSQMSNEKERINVDIDSFVPSIINEFSENNKSILGFVVDCDSSIECVVNPMLLRTVFQYLTEFSAAHVRNRSEVYIKITEDNDLVKIYYDDINAFRNIHSVDQIEPFGYGSFKQGLRGLELYLISNIVTFGLKGEMSLIESKRSEVKTLLICLPTQ